MMTMKTMVMLMETQMKAITMMITMIAIMRRMRMTIMMMMSVIPLMVVKIMTRRWMIPRATVI